MLGPLTPEIMLVDEPMRKDANSSSEMWVIRKVGFLKMHGLAGPDGLSPFFFRNGAEVLTSELTKLLESKGAK